MRRRRQRRHRRRRLVQAVASSFPCGIIGAARRPAGGSATAKTDAFAPAALEAQDATWSDQGALRIAVNEWLASARMGDVDSPHEVQCVLSQARGSRAAVRAEKQRLFGPGRRTWSRSRRATRLSRCRRAAARDHALPEAVRHCRAEGQLQRRSSSGFAPRTTTGASTPSATSPYFGLVRNAPRRCERRRRSREPEQTDDA